jgi:hypothetical protein
MLKIYHLINTIAQLQNTLKEYALKLDLRPDGERIIIHHDPFTQVEDFEDFINNNNLKLELLY